MSGPVGGAPGGTATPPRPRRHDDAIGASENRHGRPASPAVYRRRRLLALVLLLAVVAAVVLFLALVWPGFATAEADQAPEPTVTVTAEAPTPTIEPVPRTAQTPFAEALPSTVLGFALTEEAEQEEWTTAGAIEAYALRYADGPGDDAVVVTVTAGQYASEAEAQVAAQALVEAAGTGGDQGEVTVEGEVAGTWVLSPGDDGTSTVTWSNGTAVLQATGPDDVVEDVYSAYPL
ncbi:hypothetical protein [Cellulosimicrobium arenosum]|uniref:DUF4245 domain-containing protein n=1 Tax=Cellulosimicrobium arenosum TaxID=2708133 RepID=A0A927G9I7_9MICO|nr:hypothetical protein [Cellulosimicrobium arenosum]MBD8079453.1 hypothetical protein [Cellulosimicrobium arenosum]